MGRAGALLAGLLGWGLFEASWVRCRELELEVPGLPAELDGLRIVHLSDFHLGVSSPGVGAVAKAVRWTRHRDADLVVITGDLLTHPRGEPLRTFVSMLPQPTTAILGNPTSRSRATRRRGGRICRSSSPQHCCATRGSS